MWIILCVLQCLICYSVNKDHSSTNGYRPIALISCVGKLLERIIAKRLTWYLETNKLISKHQAGFRPRHNTYDLLVRLTEDIAESLGKTKKASQITVGFALESQDEVINAQRKLEHKNFDFIVLNSLRDSGAGFQYDTNKVTFIFGDAEAESLPLKLKTEIAVDIVDQVVKIARQKQLIA